jgi:hypothetical protein
MIIEGSNFTQPATTEQIALLRQSLPSETPSDYFEFFTRSDGGHVWFDKEDPIGFGCVRIYSVSRMLQLQSSFAKVFPSLLVIGSDQGTQYFGYDMSDSKPWPIVMLLPGFGATKVASSFVELAERYFLNTGEAVVI